MCFFITLVVRGGDATTIDRVLRRYGRQAKPIRNASLANELAPGEAQFLTTVGHCDCGTVLAPAVADGGGKRAGVADLSKKGWSQAKIERWRKDREKAETRAQDRRHATAPDSLELWSEIIATLMATPGVQQAGLLLHFFSGDIEDEAIEPKRMTVPVRDFASRLQAIREDQLLIAS